MALLLCWSAPGVGGGLNTWWCRWWFVSVLGGGGGADCWTGCGLEGETTLATAMTNGPAEEMRLGGGSDEE